MRAHAWDQFNCRWYRHGRPSWTNSRRRERHREARKVRMEAVGSGSNCARLSFKAHDPAVQKANSRDPNQCFDTAIRTNHRVNWHQFHANHHHRGYTGKILSGKCVGYSTTLTNSVGLFA